MPQGILAVLWLVTRLGILDHDLVGLTGERVDELIMQTYAGLDLVDVLTAGAGTTEGIPTDTGRVHLHFDRIVDERHHEHGCKTRHTFALRVVRADTHETVYAVLALQIAVRHVAFDIERHGFDARFVTFLQVLDRHFIIVLLAVPHVHTHQLLRPVLGLRATGTGHDLQHRRHLVLFVRKHVLHLQVLYLFQRLGISGIDLFFGH